MDRPLAFKLTVEQTTRLTSAVVSLPIMISVPSYHYLVLLPKLSTKDHLKLTLELALTTSLLTLP
jgi:hypothetical protein